MATKKNFTVNGREYYRITRTIGHKLVDGEKKPIKKQFVGTSKKNAEQKYDEWKEDQRNKNARIIDDGRTFAEVATYFTDNVLAVDSRYASGTRKKYKSAYMTHVKPYENLAGKELVNVTAEDIQLMYNSLKVSKSTISAVNKFMRIFCKWSVRNRYTENFMDAVVLPEKKDTGNTSGEIIVRTDIEMEKIINSIGEHRLCFLVVMAFCTGLRISELFGLKYSDFSNDFVNVERQYCDGEISSPKNNSDRQVPINNMAKRELARHRKWHTAEMQKNKYNTDFIFTTAQGTLLDRRNTKRSLDRFYEHHGIEKKKFHAYRATFCTDLCRAGVPIQTASKLMGHKSIEVTAKYYTSVSNDEKIDAVNKLPDFTTSKNTVVK